MTDRTALIHMVLENPAEDTVRLALADLLRESDDAGDQARGRFLWAGVTASRYRHDDLIDDPAYYAAQREIAAVADEGHPAQWLEDLGLCAGRPAAAPPWVWQWTHDQFSAQLGRTLAVFTRGMLSKLNVALDTWYSVAAGVLRSQPLEAVAAADVPGLTFAIESVDSSWRLTARLKLPARSIPLLSGPIPTSYLPTPVLVQDECDWWAEQLFADRAELTERIGVESQSLAACLRETAGRAWPRPLR